MKRLDFEGLQYYTSKLLGKIKSWFVGFTPTVHVRPSDDLEPSCLDELSIKIGDNRVGPDVESDLPVQIYSDTLAFVIRCDSEESARHIIESGEYSFRFSYLSKRYKTPKWICPSRNHHPDSWVLGTAWEQIPLTEDYCSTHGPSIIVNTGWKARDLMLEMVTKYYIGEGDSLRETVKALPSENVLPFLLENAIMFGSNIWCIYAPKIIKKRILFKGVVDYLNDIEQPVTRSNIQLAPSNSYGIPVKASVWKGDLELPGASVGVVSVHKKYTSSQEIATRFFYKYKETKRY